MGERRVDIMAHIIMVEDQELRLIKKIKMMIRWRSSLVSHSRVMLPRNSTGTHILNQIWYLMKICINQCMDIMESMDTTERTITTEKMVTMENTVTMESITAAWDGSSGSVSSVATSSQSEVLSNLN